MSLACPHLLRSSARIARHAKLGSSGMAVARPMLIEPPLRRAEQSAAASSRVARSQRTDNEQRGAGGREAVHARLRRDADNRRGSRFIERSDDTVVEDVLPPKAFLQSAKKAGALDIEAEAAMEVLRKYFVSSKSGGKDWERQLCSAENVKPQTLTMLAAIINRCGTAPHKIFAKKVMLSASALGDSSATIQLVKSAVSRDELDHPFMNAPLSRLDVLVKSSNVEAMVLLGKVLETRGQSEEALSMFQRAAESMPADLPNENADLVAQSLVYRGELLVRKGDSSGAELNFRRAALELDNPAAYFHLAQLQAPDSAAKEVYLIKAASSGIIEACHDLGELQLSKAQSTADNGRRAMAKEWLYLGASGGHGPSMLSLASLLRTEGQVKEGLNWLATAETNPAVSDAVLKQATSLRRQWSA
ncbi:MAG: hypothetical protein M1818_007878 [Claussenomyces sp. TS43310]|nr:MAG: hypothetical protein M1818_007878 [Claussenomyces sp. TS43310]